ncbi:MAG: DNA-protecting protein DprA [Gemmatimonadetes bacterium]|nr:DNA-protecting protein DprA [Gemmatimonadota bacterium]
MADAPPPGGGRDELAAYLALTQLPGIGAARLRTLLAAFETAHGVLAAPHGALAALPGFSVAAATAIRALRLETGHRILDALDRLGARVLVPADPAFPALLDEIPEPPGILYVWGDVSLLARPAVAIVGSRDHTAYGGDAARLLAAGVARAAVVVSGMARGIDAIAHVASLDAGGASVGILGNGFGVVYPAANRALYERMVAQGCLVTEHPPGERPHAGAFPRRNRLISGLAGATVVVEAKPQSGAIITADCALEQGRAVLAVPGPITSPTSLGCNRLIQQGAKPALCAGDVLEELGVPVPRDQCGAACGSPSAPGHPKGLPSVVAAPVDLNALQQSLWDALSAEPRHVDALVAVARQETSAVLTALTEMEMRGLVRQEPGMRFVLNAEVGMRNAE